MTGPWHYHQAERLLMVATTQCAVGSAEQESALAQAAIHAQLATAAAAVDAEMGHLKTGMEDYWRSAMHTQSLGGPSTEPSRWAQS